MIRFLMDQNDTNSDQEKTIRDILLDTSTTLEAGSRRPDLVELASHLDARQLADELENDADAAAVALRRAQAYQNAGHKPLSWKLTDFLNTLAWQHRNRAIDTFVTQASPQGLYQSIAPGTLKTMANYLMKGNTNEAEEDTLINLIAQASPAQKNHLLDPKDTSFLKRLADELDSEDIVRLKAWARETGNPGAVKLLDD